MSEGNGLTTHALLNRAYAFPLDEVLTRYSREAGVSHDVAAEHERELKRYLVMRALSPGKSYPMVDPIDGLWHVLLLYTRRYCELCDTLAGHFIHHEPRPITAGGDEMAIATRNYEAFLVDYESVFNEPAPYHLWPRVGDPTLRFTGC